MACSCQCLLPVPDLLSPGTCSNCGCSMSDEQMQKAQEAQASNDSPTATEEQLPDKPQE